LNAIVIWRRSRGSDVALWLRSLLVSCACAADSADRPNDGQHGGGNDDGCASPPDQAGWCFAVNPRSAQAILFFVLGMTLVTRGGFAAIRSKPEAPLAVIERLAVALAKDVKRCNAGS
jgi:hypothetical protein